jgi:hypothetical protein
MLCEPRVAYQHLELLSRLRVEFDNSDQLQFKYDIVPNPANSSSDAPEPPMRRPYARVLPLYLVSCPRACNVSPTRPSSAGP